MLFNSIDYALFLPIVFILYWLLPHRLRWGFLFISSYYFYMCWNAKYVFLIAITTIISYTCAIAIEKTENMKLKKAALLTAIFVSLGLLFVFKYFNFTIASLAHVLPIKPIYLDFLLPVGISFYTFQTLSYVADVYKGKVKAEKNLIVYATFVSFFPQLVAGPIERTANLLPQIKRGNYFDYSVACEGLLLIIWGLYKKLVIADNLAVWVDKVYGNATHYQGFSLLLATFFFTIQIYCDFSGYTDIARGSAKLFNIELMENFKSPYFAAGFKDFWSRWHISLSTWFRDYVYIPLGGNRVPKMRHAFNLIITFLISGLWHGANWTFVLWGGIHGIGVLCDNYFIKRKNRSFRLLHVLVTFTMVMLAWVFFRSSNVRDAFYVFSHTFLGLTNLKLYFMTGLKALSVDFLAIVKIGFVYFLPLLIYDYLSMKKDIIKLLAKQCLVLRSSVIFFVALLVLIFGHVGQSSFVYFQF